jgi:hypothetical protein
MQVQPHNKKAIDLARPYPRGMVVDQPQSILLSIPALSCIGLGEIKMLGAMRVEIPRYNPSGTGRDLYLLQNSEVPAGYRDGKPSYQQINKPCIFREPYSAIGRKGEPCRNRNAIKANNKRTNKLQSRSISRLSVPHGLDAESYAALNAEFGRSQTQTLK